MASHSDIDHDRRRDFLKEMELRAEIMSDLTKNNVANDERVLEQWDAEGIRVQRLPDDMSGVLRISIGGGDHLPVRGNYCNFRGDQSQCIALLEKCLAALKAN